MSPMVVAVYLVRALRNVREIAPLKPRVKKLGSLLGDDEDVHRRMELANIQFRKLANVWEPKKNKGA